MWDIYTHIGVGGRRTINSSTLDVKGDPLSIGRYSGNLEAGCDRLARAILGPGAVSMHMESGSTSTSLKEWIRALAERRSRRCGDREHSSSKLELMSGPGEVENVVDARRVVR